jgi:hypothetical protein
MLPWKQNSVAWQTIVCCLISNNNQTHLTSKTGFDKTGIT